jgi:RNA polymerase sigma-70 factor (ECF subfamily)
MSPPFVHPAQRAASRSVTDFFPVTQPDAARYCGVEPETERALLQRLQLGDAAAFDAIYEHFRPRVFAFVFRMCGRRALAEDLSQEVWLRLARHAKCLRPDTRLRPWLFTVARNLLVSQLRGSARDAVGLDAIVLAAGLAVATPEHLVAAQHTYVRLERAIASLSTDLREALLLVSVEQLAPTEAAEVVGVRPETLRQRLFRARAQVGDALEATERVTPSTRRSSS